MVEGAAGACPNCGHDLATERIVRQPAGHREVRLHWMICVRCRHVALYKWSYVDEAGTAPAHANQETRRLD